MCLHVVHGCRRCFPTCWLREFIPPVRRCSSLRLPPAWALLLRHCQPGSILKMKLMAYLILKEGASRSRSIVTDLRLILTATIELLLPPASTKCAAVSLDAYPR